VGGRSGAGQKEVSATIRKKKDGSLSCVLSEMPSKTMRRLVHATAVPFVQDLAICAQVMYFVEAFCCCWFCSKKEVDLQAHDPTFFDCQKERSPSNQPDRQFNFLAWLTISAK